MEQRIVGGRYALSGVLGVGGCGRVYRARDLVLDREVAVKTLRFTERTASLRDTMRRRLAREAEALASIDHPNVLTLHGQVEVDGEPALVVGLATFGELGEFLQSERGRRLTARRRLELFADAARGVLAAHRQGFVHRDIKPSNILVSETPYGLSTWVSDFGMVRALDARWTGGLTGQALGTPVYMAPEQHGQASTVDHRADVFALGLVLHAMLGGTPGGGAPVVRGSIQARACPRVVAGVDVDAVILRCTHPEPAHRYPGCHALLAALGFGDGGASPDFEVDPTRFSERLLVDEVHDPPPAPGRLRRPTPTPPRTTMLRALVAIGVLGTGALVLSSLATRGGLGTPGLTMESQALEAAPGPAGRSDPGCSSVLGAAASQFSRCDVAVCEPPTPRSAQRTAIIHCPAGPEDSCESLWQRLEAAGDWSVTRTSPSAHFQDVAGPGGRGVWSCERGPHYTEFRLSGGFGPPVVGGSTSPSPAP